ncbi:MAG TPA: DUF5683 domain-containing protein [Candidatus Binatia bacterium]|nr:DUF5683 domain-containing protein [Candidatus Binatia bacterium]
MKIAIALLLAGGIGLVSPRLARGADVPGHAASLPVRTMSKADSAAAASKPKTAPWKVMARSAIVPGWGQMYNHQPLKAVLVVGAEGSLVALALHELKLQNDAKQRAADAAVFGDSTAFALADLEAETHRNRKISWIWWTLAAHLISMADAYVDAHLSTFDSDFGKQESLLPPRPGDRPVIALAYRVRF